MLVLCTLAAGTAVAADADEEPSELPELRYDACLAEDRARLRFLEERLEDNAPYARWWWRSWIGVYALGIGFEGTQAVLENDHRGGRANSVASAAKSAIGLARGLTSRPTAMKGEEELGPIRDAASCHERLELAEERLTESADEADSERFGWLPHTLNFALNASAAVVVAELYDYDPAYFSGALGFAVGELRIWTFPWQAVSDIEDYERRFGTVPAEPETSWHIEPWSNGARLVVRF